METPSDGEDQANLLNERLVDGNDRNAEQIFRNLKGLAGSEIGARVENGIEIETLKFVLADLKNVAGFR
jgi:hypothetical protein